MQAVAPSVASMGGAEQQHRRTPSIVSPPPTTNSHSTPAVRLPPVSIPREGFLPVSFNPERRQSINSDPFLHAFSTTSDPSYLRRPSIDEASSLFGGPLGAQGGNVAGSAVTGSGNGSEGRVGGVMPNIRPHSSTAKGEMPPPQQPFDPHANYQFGTSFQPPAGGGPPPHPPHPTFPGPTSAYRFGGPSVSVAAPHETPSYFDYSMRRHSLTNNQQNGNSPTRYSGPNAAAGGGGPLSPISSTKRKTSGEENDHSFNDGSYYPSQNAAPFPPSSMNGNPPPNSKRRTSSMATDKMNSLALDEQRRESFSPTWEEERRDSNESHRSSGSHHSFNMYQYPAQPPPPGSAPFDQHNPAPHPNPHQHPPHPPFMRLSNVPNFYEDSVGPRGSIARGMYEPLSQDFGRRPSIPGVSQMMQGQAPFYPGPPPHSASAPPTAQHPSSSPAFPPPPQPRSSQSNQPAVMVSSASQSQTPTDHQPQPLHFRSGSTGVPIGPPPQWPTSDVPPPPPHPDRQDSTGSLDPNAVAGLKDSPYSRSPQLRISHKLAERKRRKEMAQLFDDLRESLPVDRGLKSSKWEILTKAVEFIGQLKTFNRDLQADNQNLRQHLNLPQSQPVPHEFLPPRSNSTPHPLQPAPAPHPSQSQPPPNNFPPHPQHSQHPVHNAAHIYDHSRPHPSPPISNHPDPHSHNASPRPHTSRTGSHASSHASSFSAESGMPPP